MQSRVSSHAPDALLSLPLGNLVTNGGDAHSCIFPRARAYLALNLPSMLPSECNASSCICARARRICLRSSKILRRARLAFDLGLRRTLARLLGTSRMLHAEETTTAENAEASCGLSRSPRNEPRPRIPIERGSDLRLPPPSFFGFAFLTSFSSPDSTSSNLGCSSPWLTTSKPLRWSCCRIPYASWNTALGSHWLKGWIPATRREFACVSLESRAGSGSRVVFSSYQILPGTAVSSSWQKPLRYTLRKQVC